MDFKALIDFWSQGSAFSAQLEDFMAIHSSV